MRLLALLTGCTVTSVTSSNPEDRPGAGVHDEILPGDTAGKDTAGEVAKVEQTTPAQMTIDCAGLLREDVDTPCEVKVESVDWPEAIVSRADVHIRGRSSAGFPKPQYKLSFIDDAGNSNPLDLLGMGRDDDWVLNGMWIDRAMIRNKLAYDLFNELTAAPDWAPDSAYAELWLDGEFQGLYLLTEPVNHDASRIDFADDDGTGARFIVAADEEEGFTSNVQYAKWRIDYPVPADQTAAVTAGVAATLAVWENAILRGGDPFETMNLDSFVHFILIEELMKNNDAYFLSHRVWRGDDGELRMVPWDLDLTLGQPNYNDNSLFDQWVLYRPDLVGGSRNAAFLAALKDRWEAARAGPLGTDAVIGRIEVQRSVMAAAIDRNWERWDITTVDFGGSLYAVSSSEDEFEHVETWVRARLEWMDDNIAIY